MADKLTVNLKDRAPATGGTPAPAPEPAPRSLEEIVGPDAPVVQKVALIDHSHVPPKPPKPRTMADVKI